MIEYHNILNESLRGVSSWIDLQLKLEKYNVNDALNGIKDTRAGKVFEVFAKYFFQQSPLEEGNYKNIWLFDEVPLFIREKLNIKNQDYGVDLILETVDGLLYVVQCKFKNDSSSRLNWSADKIANLFAFCPQANGYIVFTNASELDSISKTRYDNFFFYSISDLLCIEKETFGQIESAVQGHCVPPRVKYMPKPHQEVAIEKCVENFSNQSRGQLILPCGAGKTYTALWIKERLCANNTLVLVPSLALLRQIKSEWHSQRTDYYTHLCVCSEKDIDNDTQDETISHLYEIDVNVTTDAKKIQLFIQRNDATNVIFSTYHSLNSIAQAIEGTDFQFDFIFCDEAHKTAGIGVNKFGLVHDNIRLPAKRRLYATATPRIVKESLKKKLGDDLSYAYDMNDPKVFGDEFYRMTFKEAIEQDILVDYKIVVIGVGDKELEEYIRSRKFIHSDNTSIDEIANSFALDQVMRNYGASHAITFHSRVKFAKKFSQIHASLFESTNCYAVSGEQLTSERNLILNDFRSSDKAIVSNARCLTEGIDVPTIDLVYFCDPKNSKVDIVQASGRALRKKEGKKQGLIVVPIYHSDKSNVEQAITQSSFKNLISVIRALCDQDERLQDEISRVAYEKGERQNQRIEFANISLGEDNDKIILQGFEPLLRESLFHQIIEKSSGAWEMWFIELKDYLAKNSKYPTKEENTGLYHWLGSQRNRRNNNHLSYDKIRRLDNIGFVWDMQEEKWMSMYEVLNMFVQTNSNEPNKENSYRELIQWYKVQKADYKAERLREDRVKLFEPIINGFSGGIIDEKWEKIYLNLITFRDNNSSWPVYDRLNKESIESKLSNFCQAIRKRYRDGELSDYWFNKMLDISFNFEGKQDNWEKRCKQISRILQETDSVSIKKINENDYSWIIRHKKKHEDGVLTKKQSKLIESLNLDDFFENWDAKFERVEAWIAENGKMPTRITNKEFSCWLISQRIVFKNGNLSTKQINKLESTGFDLYAKGNEKREEVWVDKLEQIKDFILSNNRWPAPSGDKCEQTLYNWCQAQRQAQQGTAKKRMPLEQWKVDMLNEINFVWSLDDRWDNYYQQLKELVERDEFKNMKTTEPLWRWVYNQNFLYERGNYDEKRVDKLSLLGIDVRERANRDDKVLNSIWVRNMKSIAEFVRINGYYPKAGGDSNERNLYNSLYKTKKASAENKLTNQQLELLRELDILEIK